MTIKLTRDYSIDVKTKTIKNVANVLTNEFATGTGKNTYKNCVFIESDRYESTPLQLYQKYSYEDVCKLLEWEFNVVAQNIGGYKYDDKTKTYPVFINYNKEEHISDSIKYEDWFISQSRLITISKSNRHPHSKDVQTAYKTADLGVNMELFVRKNKDDKMSKEFYYLGRMNTVGDPQAIQMNGQI